ncbi:MAG TPA: hypothetical protein VLW50_24365 [Streptosporangiaceae bacterium]|nr:hypothetical protein [Streptosporangiaceae bacterium]
MESVPGSAERKRAAARGKGPAAAGAYGLLFLFGLLQGMTGSFQYGRSVGPVPVAAVGFALAIGLTCVLCGRGMRSAGGALAPAIGWLLASFVLAMSRPSGSVVITNTAAGEVYLFAGALGAAIGAGVGFSGWSRKQAMPLPPHGPAPLKRRSGR